MLLFVVLLLAYESVGQMTSRPNIVFIFADDLGFGDVSFRNPAVRTPRMDALARQGIILDQAYAQPLCTPSRAAFLTGRYPFTIGMQHMVIRTGAPYCLPADLKTLPQHLKEAGYSTHIVGKWHLGCCNPSCFPTHRGFDSFFGYVNGFEDYYSRENNEYGDSEKVYDFWNGTTVHFDNMSYSMDLYERRAAEIIKNHNSGVPLFLYLTPPTPHGPLQVPAEYSAYYRYIEDPNRRRYLGMVTVLDRFIGSVVDSLVKANMYDNTIIIFSSDNGGQSAPLNSGFAPEHSASNYPLRGSKGSLYEGGTRVVSFVHSPVLKRTGVVSKQLFHLVDWYPTILDMTGIQHDQDTIDGVSQHQALLGIADSPRKEFVYNIDYVASPTAGVVGTLMFAIRYGQYKLMMGGSGSFNPQSDLWLAPPEFSGSTISGDNCTLGSTINGTAYGCLFNLEDDPYEQHNLYSFRQDVVAEIYEELDTHMCRFVEPLYREPLPYQDIQIGGVQRTGYC